MEFHRTEARNCEKRPPAVFREALLEKAPAYGVFTLDHGRVFGTEPAVIAADDAVLLDLSMQWAPFHAEIYTHWQLPKVKVIDAPVLVLAGAPGSNYSHWCQQMLPRLDLVDRAGFKRNDFAAIVVNRGAPFIEESLRLLGIPLERCIATAPDMHLSGNPLVVPSVPRSGNPSPWIPAFLRKSFWPTVEISKVDSPKRLYISRARARSRKIQNEEELKPLLKEYGFSFFHLEDFPLMQQIQLFANAEVICGVHGSGLTNVFFSRPGSKLIEIYHPQFPEIFWWTSASVSDVEYYFMLGEGNQVDYVPEDETLNHLDVACDPAKLRATFDLAGI